MLEKLIKLLKSLVFRIQALKVMAVLAFVVIAVQLYSIQVTHSEDYQGYVDRQRVISLQKNVPRGVVYDRNFDVLVDNEAVSTITYQLYSGVSSKEMKEVAANLAALIEVDYNFLTSRDLKDIYIEHNPEDAKELVSDEEFQAFPAKTRDADYYALQLSRVTDEMLEQVSVDQREAHAIYINMNKGTNLTSNIIKKGATAEEVAIVSEHLESLPGVNTEVDWDRIYPSVAGYHPLYGRVSSYTQGLPASMKGYYLGHDYQLNDRVGMSQLELYYEPLLRGHKSQYILTSGNDVSEYTEIYEGQRGYEATLTIDAELQAAVDKIVTDELLETKRLSGTDHLREAYIAMLNPQTGEVLALSGKIIEYNEEERKYEVFDNALGTLQNAFTMGSIVKGATLLAGYNYGVTDIGEYITDAPMTFKGGLIKGSWKPLGYINDSDALKFSSNVYFFLQTIQLGGSRYTPNGPLVLDLDTFNLYRDFFAQFGLGVSTGIDLPNESIGLKDFSNSPGKLLDFAIGQADIYTPLQMAQYVSTIATGGLRYAPQLLKDLYVPSNDSPEEKQLLQSFEPNLLNVVEMDQKYFDRVNHGFIRALQEVGGTGYGVFQQADYNPAGKTGTAQEYVRDEEGKYVKDSNGEFIEVFNRSLVAYAPADNPEVAIAVITPQSETPNNSNTISLDIGHKAMKAYFELAKNNTTTSTEKAE